MILLAYCFGSQPAFLMNPIESVTPTRGLYIVFFSIGFCSPTGRKGDLHMLPVKLFIISCLLVLVSCAHQPSTALDPQSMSTGATTEKTAPRTLPQVILGPGDVIDVKFRVWPELDYQQTIRPDGRISLQLIDDVIAAGRTPQELDNHLTERYTSKLKAPEITVIVVSLAGQNVYVGGEVQNPGLLALTGNMSALQAVIHSGGLKESARANSAIIIRKGPDNQPVPIPLNLETAMMGNAASTDMQLQPNDVIYVPKTTIAKVNNFIRQYIEELFLFRGISLGFGYDLDNNN
jgi:protein involved in polysaccharide export with SLBB domain